MSQMSIIVPVYKVEQYIKRCVDSILGQTFTDIELILIDDGSPDNCPTICDEYAQTDPRVHVIHQKNGGLSAARNAGIDWVFANSDSKWITFIDSDDWVHPRYLEILYEASTKNSCKISMCILTNVYEQIKISEINNFNVKIVDSIGAYNIYEGKFYAYSCGKLFQRDLFNDVRFPVRKLFEDWFTTYKLLFKTDNIAIVDSSIYYYLIRNDSISNKSWSPDKMDVLQALDKKITFFKDNNIQHLYTLSKHWSFVMTYNHYYECRNSNIKNKFFYILFLRFRMKRLLLFCRKDFSINIKNHPEYFECAYPIFMFFYWYVCALKKRFSNNKD
ncbi:MAG: glycosyltransferase family 2 protein [Clostridia bacterium]|nr:glycosyltransferase family 2 protein [Clostridia bacterium]